MKKLMLTLLAAGSMAAANAQSHTILLYGNATVNTDQQEYVGDIKTNSVQWGINPGIGYQFSPHWTIGVEGGFRMGRNPQLVNGSTQTTVTNDWNAGVFARYTKYFGPIFFIYGQLEGSYVGGNTQVEDITDQSSYNGFNVNLFPGIGAFVAKGLALNFSVGGIGYTGVNWSDNSLLKSENKFNFTFGQQFNFGISKNFGCRGGHHHMHGHHEPGDEMRHMDTSDDDDEDAPPPPHHMKEKKHTKEKKAKKAKKHDDEDED